jgi:protein-S-isoprenylcysteine O-methyltransferase Ste14
MPEKDIDISERPSAIPWPPILWLGGIAAAVLLGFLVPLPWPGMDDGPARAIGLGFGIIGAALLIYAMLTLRRHNTTMLPDAGASVLVTSGPYWRFRNPIYLADVLILLGLAELSKNVWFVVAAALFAVLVTKLAIVPEERHLERRFGEAYRDYKARSRRWI